MLVLVINCGSSSVKYRLFDMRDESVLADGLADRVGVKTAEPSSITHRRRDGDEVCLTEDLGDHRVAVSRILDLLTDRDAGVLDDLGEIGAVGHRVVHGGDQFTGSVLIDDEVIGAVERWSELAPLHNPPNLAGIRACAELMSGVSSVAVFDTAFHATMPAKAYLYALPREVIGDLSLRRYGFHGTSHRYVYLAAEAYLAERGVDPARAQVITTHLGNGCSITAVRGGRVQDTSMGFTPLEGLVMGTRSGDVDPAVVAFLCEKLDRSADEVTALLNRQSGLLGLSGVSNDMRDVLARAEEGDERCRQAVEVFCYRVQKYVGGLHCSSRRPGRAGFHRRHRSELAGNP